jgi:hypothetical protein
MFSTIAATVVRSLARSSSGGRLPGKELRRHSGSSKGGVTQGCRCAPMQARPARAISASGPLPSGWLATG